MYELNIEIMLHGWHLLYLDIPSCFFFLFVSVQPKIKKSNWHSDWYRNATGKLIFNLSNGIIQKFNIHLKWIIQNIFFFFALFVKVHFDWLSFNENKQCCPTKEWKKMRHQKTKMHFHWEKKHKINTVSHQKSKHGCLMFVSYRRLIYLFIYFFSMYFETVLKKRVKEDRKWEKWKLKWEFLLIWKFRRNLNPVVNLNHVNLNHFWLNRVKCAEFF